MRTRSSSAALFAAAILFLARIAQPLASPDPILVLVSFDGWRWDYSDRMPAPNVRALAARGVRVEQLVPSFPVLTFPNHYTIVTGLYPAHHGIVANTMTDPTLPDRFSMTSDAVRDSRWWGGEPIWVTAMRQGRRTAAMFWPGTEADIRGKRPTYWRPFDGTVPAGARVAQVLEWLALPESRRPSFVTLYFDDVDHAGHDFGVDSPQLTSAVATLDRALGTLVAGIERLGLADRTSVVVVSDHGMAPLADDRIIWLDDYIDTAGVDITEGEGVLLMAPRDGTAASAATLYQRLEHAHPRLRVFTRETLPARLRYSGSARIPPIVGIPDVGWIVTTRARRRQRIDEGRTPQRGTHGFDPADDVMHAILIAAGPDIRRGVVVPSIDNVNVYNFLCAILKVKPSANDGDPAQVSAWLQRSPAPQHR